MAGANLDLEEKSSMHVHMTALMAEQDAATHMGSSEYNSLQRSIFDVAFPFVTPRCKIVDLLAPTGIGWPHSWKGSKISATSLPLERMD